MKNLQLPDNVLLLPLSCGVHDDFRTYVDGGEWTKLAADSGASVAAGDTEDGVLALTTGATDNNEAAVSTTKKIFLVGTDKPHVMDAFLKISEANVDDANIFVGFSSVIGANQMVDDGAGPATTMSGAGFYAVDSPSGTKCWSVIVSNGSTQSTWVLNKATALNKIDNTITATNQLLGIEILPKTSTVADILFKINGKCVFKVTDWSYASIAAMYAGAYVKAGGAHSEVLNVDYISAYKVR